MKNKKIYKNLSVTGKNKQKRRKRMLIDNDKAYDVLQNSRNLFPCYSNKSPKEGYRLNILADIIAIIFCLLGAMMASLVLTGTLFGILICLPPLLILAIVIPLLYVWHLKKGKVTAISLDKDNIHLIIYGMTMLGISEIRDISVPLNQINKIKFSYDTDATGKAIYNKIDESFPKNSLLANSRIKISIHTQEMTYTLYAQKKSPAYKILWDLNKAHCS